MGYPSPFKLFENYGIDNIDIILIESFPCSNKYELLVTERNHIENENCINRNIPNRSRKEWNNTNKEKLKEYREQNKEKMLQQTKEWRKNNSEVVKQTVKDYQEKNKNYLPSNHHPCS